MGHANVPQPIQLLAFGIFHLLLSGDCQRLAKPVRTEMSCPSMTQTFVGEYLSQKRPNTPT